MIALKIKDEKSGKEVTYYMYVEEYEAVQNFYRKYGLHTWI